MKLDFVKSIFIIAIMVMLIIVGILVCKLYRCIKDNYEDKD